MKIGWLAVVVVVAGAAGGAWAGRAEGAADAAGLAALRAEGAAIGKAFRGGFRAPLLVLPGLGGSVLDATFTAAHTPPHWYCTKTQDAHLMWLRVSELAPKVHKCFFYNIQLEYDAATDAYANVPGVEIAPRGFGNFTGCTCLDPDRGFCTVTAYMAKLVAAFEAAGYTPGVDVRAATYDFRLPPTANAAYFDAVRTLVEQMSADAGGLKVHIMGHSMGGCMAWQFLTMQEDAWKAQYVASYIPLGAPLGGAAGIAGTLISGRNFAIPYFNRTLFDADKFAAAIQGWGGVVWMSPNALAATPRCIVTDGVTGACYSRDDLGALYTAAGANKTAAIYAATSKLNLGAAPPGVTVHCGIGANVSTIVSYDYPNGLAAQPVETNSIDGDGTVPGPSLRVCGSWLQDAPVHVTAFDGVEHGAMPSTPAVLTWLLDIVTTPQ